jgi:hypothetical protein
LPSPYSEETPREINKEHERNRLHLKQPVDRHKIKVKSMELGRSRTLQHPAQEVRHRFSHTQRLLPKKNKKSTQGKTNHTQNRYKLYANMERKRERAESNNLRAISELFRQVE